MKKVSLKFGRYLLFASFFPLTISCNNANQVVNTISLKSISISGEYQTTFYVGDTFNYNGLVVTAFYTNNSFKIVSDYTVSSPNMNTAGVKAVRVAYSENNITKSQVYNITVNKVSPQKVLTSISLSGNYQTTFTVNDAFNYNGLIVTTNYDDGSYKNVTGYNVSTPDMSSSGSKTVTVSYSENNITKSTSYFIQVNEITPPISEKVLTSISLSGNYQTTFNINDTFSYNGLVVSAIYSDNSSKTLTNYSVSAPDMTSSGSKTVTVSYSENNVTKNATYTINVNELLISKLDPRDEPYLYKQYYLNHIGDIKTVWESYRGKGITVAVIDVGFYYQHEDFKFADGTSKISPLSGSITSNGNNSTFHKGVSYLSGDDNHGTFCAGVVGAGLNGKGIVGIAPECNLLLLKTDAKPASINYAFKYASDNGAKVITISIGDYNDGSGELDTGGVPLYNYFDSAVAYARNKGTVVISAAGNGGPSEGNRPTEYTYPGATTGVIGVGGLSANTSTTVWSGSSYNSSPQYQFCDVFAPAHEMFGMCTNNNYDGGWKGTSFASPIVAGIAALYFEKNPTHTVSQFENKLYNSCLKIDDSGHYGYGAVDIAKTLDLNANNKNITVKIKANWTNMYAYQWNLRQGVEKLNWPGEKLSKDSNGYYTLSISPVTYDSLIFSNGTGLQTIDILTTFLDGRIYDLSGSEYVQLESKLALGHYLKESS